MARLKDNFKESVKSGEQKVVVKPELTIKWLADRLIKIEDESGYETALQGVRNLNYPALCELVDLESTVNNPNLMPSRFMILPEASDTELESNNNLDSFPYPLHDNHPHIISVQKLGELLTFAGYLNGDMPIWHEITGVNENNQPLTFESFDETMLKAFYHFLEKNKSAGNGPEIETTYTSLKGDSLKGIAQEYSLPSWEIILEANEGVFDNSDVIPENTTLTIPSISENPLVATFILYQWDKQYLNGKSWKYPGGYLSVSLLNPAGEPIEFSDEKFFDVYIVDTKATPLYSFSIDDYSQVLLVAPEGIPVSYGIQGFTFNRTDGTAYSREAYLKNLQQEGPSGSDLDSSDLASLSGPRVPPYRTDLNEE
ncbi:MAG: LysM peptidoglycan-binding domain-containing protein [Fibrobacterales bacterium]